jgi:hypothetical protein
LLDLAFRRYPAPDLASCLHRSGAERGVRVLARSRIHRTIEHSSARAASARRGGRAGARGRERGGDSHAGSSPGTSSAARLEAAIVATRDHLRERDPSFPAVDPARCAITIAAGQLGGGYALPTKKGAAAIAMARERAGLALEPTYTGKALAALIDDAPSLADRVVLFWNSQSSRPLAVTSIDGQSHALPAAFQGYFPAQKR